MDAIASGQFCGHDFSRVCGLSLLYVVRVLTRNGRTNDESRDR